MDPKLNNNKKFLKEIYNSLSNLEYKFKSLKLKQLNFRTVVAYLDQKPKYVVKKIPDSDRMNKFIELLKENSIEDIFPSTVHIDFKSNIYIMKYIEGKSLRRSLLLGSLSRLLRQSAYNDFINSALVLGNFHRKTFQNMEPIRNLINMDSIKSYIQDNYYREFIIELYEEIKNIQLPVVKRHNDCSLKNFIKSNFDGKIKLTDIDSCVHPAFSYFGPGLIDIFYFKINCLSFLRFSPFISRSYLVNIIRLFEKSYFDSTKFHISQKIKKIYLFLFYLFFFGAPKITEMNLFELYSKSILKNRFFELIRKWSEKPFLDFYNLI